MNHSHFLELILALLGVISFLEIGLLADFYLINKRKLKFSFPKFLGLGIGSIGLFQIIAGLLQTPINQIFVFALFLLLGLPFIFDEKLVKALKKLINPEKNVKFLPIFLVIIFLSFLWVKTFSHTIWGSDAYNFWLAKASAFYRDGMITKENVSIYWPYDHPLLWPLSAVWIYHFLGKVNEYFFQIIPFSIFFSMILAFYQNIQKRKMIWICIIALTPFLWANVAWAEYAGNADLLVSFYFLLSVIMLLRREFIYTVLFLFFAVLTKNDALPALVVFLLFSPWLLKIKNNLKLWFFAFSLFVANLAWKSNFGLSNRYLEIERAVGRPLASYMWYSLNAFREEFRQVYRWGISWWLILFLIIVNLNKILKNRLILMGFLLITFQFIGYFAVYYLTPEDQASHIATSIYRLVMQVYPAALFLASQISYNRGYHVYRNRRQ